MKNNNNIDTFDVEIIDDFDKRDFYLSVLDDAINNLHFKATKGRIRDVKNDRLKIDTYKALVYAINTANSVYRDKQIDKIADDFEKLKQGILLRNEKVDEIASGDVTDATLNDLIGFDERIKKLKENINVSISGDL